MMQTYLLHHRGVGRSIISQLYHRQNAGILPRQNIPPDPKTTCLWFGNGCQPKNRGGENPPKSSHLFIGLEPLFSPSILGYHYFWKHPNPESMICILGYLGPPGYVLLGSVGIVSINPISPYISSFISMPLLSIQMKHSLLCKGKNRAKLLGCLATSVRIND